MLDALAIRGLLALVAVGCLVTAARKLCKGRGFGGLGRHWRTAHAG